MEETFNIRAQWKKKGGGGGYVNIFYPYQPGRTSQADIGRYFLLTF